jgi:multiple sugar transport system substrate-binding protein
VAAMSYGSPALLAKRSQESVTVRMAWWGGDARHSMMNELLDMYEERNPGVTIEREFTDFGPYWERLSTQVAAGNAPDLIHFHPSYAGSYARRGLVLDLEPQIAEGNLDLSNFDEIIIESGMVDGSLYYVSIGNTGPSLYFNTVMFDTAGIDLPTNEWTWDDFNLAARELSAALGEDVYGTSDQGGSFDPFRVYLRQRGKDTVNAEGQLGFGPQDLHDWLSMWESLRQDDAAPPLDITVEAGVPQETSLLANRMAAMHMTNANQLKIFQRFIEDELSLVTLPDGVGEDLLAGDFLVVPTIAISAGTEHPAVCARIIDFMVNDPDAARLYNAEHGPPGSAEIRDLLIPQLEREDQVVFEFVQDVIATNPVPPEPVPTEYPQIGDLFARTNQDIGYGAVSVDEAVASFFEEAERILA